MDSFTVWIYRFSHYSRKLCAGLVILTIGFFFTENGECGQKVSTLKHNTFRMAMSRPEGTPLYKRVELIYKEIFRRLNINLTFEHYPFKRASKEVNSGRADGEPSRIRSYGASYPNLVRVDEPIYYMIVAAYKANPSIPVLNGWKDLKNTDYRVEYPRGMKICEINLSKVVKSERLSTITKTSQGLQKLAIGRIDIYIDDEASIAPVLNNKKFELKGKIHTAGIMQKTPLYMYIHKKHKNLIPKLEASIRDLKSEGLIEHFTKVAFDLD